MHLILNEVSTICLFYVFLFCSFSICFCWRFCYFSKFTGWSRRTTACWACCALADRPSAEDCQHKHIGIIAAVWRVECCDFRHNRSCQKSGGRDRYFGYCSTARDAVHIKWPSCRPRMCSFGILFVWFVVSVSTMKTLIMEINCFQCLLFQP